MKKLVSVFFALFAMVACLAVNTSAAEIILDDQAGLYSDEQEAELIAIQQELCDYTGWNIALVTTDTDFPEDGHDAISYAEKYYDDHFGASSSGVLYLVDLGYRQFVTSGEADYEYFNDKRINEMYEACKERYYDYDDMGNATTYFEYVRTFYDRGPFAEDPEATGSGAGGVIFAIIAGLAAAGIGVGIVFGRYKFHAAPATNNYLDQGHVNFYIRSDRFVREYTTRTRVNSDSDSGGHGSSGGFSHGGGGGGGHR